MSECSCKLDVYQDDKCVLHCEKKKDDWYTVNDDGTKNWKPEKVKEFWKEIRRVIKKQDDSVIFFNYYFKSVYFPKFEKSGLANASDYTHNSFFEKGKVKEFNQLLRLKKCVFLDEEYLKDIKFNQGLYFDECEFLNGLDFSYRSFVNNQKVRIQNCPKIINANFKNTTFNDLADFYNTTFISAEDTFHKTNFQDISVFTKCTFRNSINFKYTTFEKLSQFKETTFEQEVNFEDAIIKDKINFLGIKKDDKKSDIKVVNRETARIIKHSFEKQDNIIEANKFYAVEMKKQEGELKWGTDFAEKLIFKFHKISSNHSQDWLLVLLWILNITFVYSAFQQDIFINEKWLLFGFFLIGFIITVIECTAFLEIRKKYKMLFFLLFGIISYMFYSLVTSDNTLYCVSNDLNPFSIMNSSNKLTFTTLVYKVAIAYLIYQLIVSIRQNTRRK